MSTVEPISSEKSVSAEKVIPSQETISTKKPGSSEKIISTQKVIPSQKTIYTEKPISSEKSVSVQKVIPSQITNSTQKGIPFQKRISTEKRIYNEKVIPSGKSIYSEKGIVYKEISAEHVIPFDKRICTEKVILSYAKISTEKEVSSKKSICTEKMIPFEKGAPIEERSFTVNEVNTEKGISTGKLISTVKRFPLNKKIFAKRFSTQKRIADVKGISSGLPEKQKVCLLWNNPIHGKRSVMTVRKAEIKKCTNNVEACSDVHFANSKQDILLKYSSEFSEDTKQSTKDVPICADIIQSSVPSHRESVLTEVLVGFISKLLISFMNSQHSYRHLLSDRGGLYILRYIFEDIKCSRFITSFQKSLDLYRICEICCRETSIAESENVNEFMRFNLGKVDDCAVGLIQHKIRRSMNDYFKVSWNDALDIYLQSYNYENLNNLKLLITCGVIRIVASLVADLLQDLDSHLKVIINTSIQKITSRAKLTKRRLILSDLIEFLRIQARLCFPLEHKNIYCIHETRAFSTKRYRIREGHFGLKVGQIKCLSHPVVHNILVACRATRKMKEIQKAGLSADGEFIWNSSHSSCLIPTYKEDGKLENDRISLTSDSCINNSEDLDSVYSVSNISQGSGCIKESHSALIMESKFNLPLSDHPHILSETKFYSDLETNVSVDKCSTNYFESLANKRLYSDLDDSNKPKRHNDTWRTTGNEVDDVNIISERPEIDSEFFKAVESENFNDLFECSSGRESQKSSQYSPISVRSYSSISSFDDVDCGAPCSVSPASLPHSQSARSSHIIDNLPVFSYSPIYSKHFPCFTTSLPFSDDQAGPHYSPISSVNSESDRYSPISPINTQLASALFSQARSSIRHSSPELCVNETDLSQVPLVETANKFLDRSESPLLFTGESFDLSQMPSAETMQLEIVCDPLPSNKSEDAVVPIKVNRLKTSRSADTYLCGKSGKSHRFSAGADEFNDIAVKNIVSRKSDELVASVDTKKSVSADSVMPLKSIFDISEDCDDDFVQKNSKISPHCSPVSSDSCLGPHSQVNLSQKPLLSLSISPIVGNQFSNKTDVCNDSEVKTVKFKRRFSQLFENEDICVTKRKQFKNNVPISDMNYNICLSDDSVEAVDASSPVSLVSAARSENATETPLLTIDLNEVQRLRTCSEYPINCTEFPRTSDSHRFTGRACQVGDDMQDVNCISNRIEESEDYSYDDVLSYRNVLFRVNPRNGDIIGKIFDLPENGKFLLTRTCVNDCPHCYEILRPEWFVFYPKYYVARGNCHNCHLLIILMFAVQEQSQYKDFLLLCEGVYEYV